MKKSIAILLLLIAFLIPIVTIFLVRNWYEGRMAEYERAAFVVIDKGKMQLTVHGLDGEVKAQWPIACGKGLGDKQVEGDNCTPEGVFRISDIQNSSNWKHDFGDGRGDIGGAYGPYFLRLSTGRHKGIGIHGTHDPGSMGKRATEGCIRLKNEDIEQLKSMAYCGLTVIVLPSEADIVENSQQSKKADNTEKPANQAGTQVNQPADAAKTNNANKLK